MSLPMAKTVGFKPGERNIFFHLLTACNLSCQHCYINPEQHGTSMVSRETMLNWLQLFYAPQKENNVIFLGGEPTMHPHLLNGVIEANRLGYQSVTIDTNGYLFHDLLDKLTPDQAVLSFSLDGPDAETNDPIRGTGVYATCTGNLKRAVAKGFRVSVIYTVSRLNLKELHRMPELLAGLGVKRFFIQVIGIRGKSAAGNGQALQISSDEWLSIIPEVARDAAGRGLDVIYPKVYLEEEEPFQCAGLVSENFFIFPNGRVYLCPLCEDFAINSYRITDNQLHKNQGLTEDKLFSLNIPEGCVMNKLLQPANILYDQEGKPLHRISCCLLKQELKPAGR